MVQLMEHYQHQQEVTTHSKDGLRQHQEEHRLQVAQLLQSQALRHFMHSGLRMQPLHLLQPQRKQKHQRQLRLRHQQRQKHLRQHLQLLMIVNVVDVQIELLQVEVYVHHVVDI